MLRMCAGSFTKTRGAGDYTSPVLDAFQEARPGSALSPPLCDPMPTAVPCSIAQLPNTKPSFHRASITSLPPRTRPQSSITNDAPATCPRPLSDRTPDSIPQQSQSPPTSAPLDTRSSLAIASLTPEASKPLTSAHATAGIGQTSSVTSANRYMQRVNWQPAHKVIQNRSWLNDATALSTPASATVSSGVGGVHAHGQRIHQFGNTSSMCVDSHQRVSPSHFADMSSLTSAVGIQGNRPQRPLGGVAFAESPIKASKKSPQNFLEEGEHGGGLTSSGIICGVGAHGNSNKGASNDPSCQCTIDASVYGRLQQEQEQC
jgi:hypothetical protein